MMALSHKLLTGEGTKHFSAPWRQHGLRARSHKGVVGARSASNAKMSLRCIMNDPPLAYQIRTPRSSALPKLVRSLQSMCWTNETHPSVIDLKKELNVNIAG